MAQLVTEKALYKLIRTKLPEVHWQRIESGFIPGIPDLNGCVAGREIWIEMKIVQGTRVKLTPSQVNWLTTRYRHGGPCFIVAWNKTTKVDDLYIFEGGDAQFVIQHGIKEFVQFVKFSAPFDWKKIANCLFGLDATEKR